MAKASFRDYTATTVLFGQKKTIYTRRVTANEVGITNSIDGHTLGLSGEPESKYGHVRFECECGDFHMSPTPKSNGMVTKSYQTKWDQHLEEAGFSRSSRIELGTIQRQKKPLQTIFVALGRYERRSDFHYGRNERPGWAVYQEADDGNSILTHTDTRISAISWAIKYLDGATRRGSIVTRESVDAAIPESDSVRGTISTLLVAEPNGVEELLKVIDAIEEVLLLVPILETRLESLREQQKDVLNLLIGTT